MTAAEYFLAITLGVSLPPPPSDAQGRWSPAERPRPTGLFCTFELHQVVQMIASAARPHPSALRAASAAPRSRIHCCGNSPEPQPPASRFPCGATRRNTS
jgi:hypothetical protein